PVEGAVPAGEDVAAARGDQVVLKRTARGNHGPLEVLLPPQVAGCRRSATDLVERQEPVVGRSQYPPVLVRVSGIEDEICGVHPGVVVPPPVRLPRVPVTPVEFDKQTVGGKSVDEAFRVIVATREATGGTDPRGARLERVRTVRHPIPP